MSRKLFFSAVFLAVSLSAQNYPAKKPPSSLPSSGAVTTCPWVTEGSAAKVLGGQVHAILNVASPTQGTCTFVKTARPQEQLKVLVGAGNIPSCPAGSARVIGVGDQASRCHLSHSAQMISGNVRAVGIAITLAAGPGSQSEDAIQQIAEQVAGNLF
jgi:hypothetical protein